MTWMVALVLMLFYFLGNYAFHQTGLTSALPYVAVAILILDSLLVRLFRRKAISPIQIDDRRVNKEHPTRSAGRGTDFSL